MKYIKLFEEQSTSLVKAEKIIKNYKPQAVKFEGDSKNGYSVLVKDKKSDWTAWVDISVENKDISADWNQYIFHKDIAEDVIAKKVQEDLDVFEAATSEAISFLETKGFIYQDEKAAWFYKTDKE